MPSEPLHLEVVGELGALSTDWDDVVARGSLRVLAVPVPGETELFDLRPGQTPGFEHELLQSFARQNKLRLELLAAGGWDRLVPELLGGRADLIAGRLVIVCQGESVELVPRVIADKIAERDPSLVVRVNKSSSEIDADDPYADYKIPDDLMW